MILGTGIDIVRIPRIAAMAERWRDRFLDRVFTPGEKEYCLKKRTPYPSLAARFAAKEAFFKASGAGSLSWRDIEVINADNGRPAITLHGNALEKFQSARIHLTLSHDGDYAMAQVIIEQAA
ncbi:MAG: holo-ACP synthase [Nitrospirae bacterium]|nr:holo-ACP synthase [Nitrospirota bacterium]